MWNLLWLPKKLGEKVEKNVAVWILANKKEAFQKGLFPSFNKVVANHNLHGQLEKSNYFEKPF